MSEQVKLEKSLSPLQVCALALGSIVGWGCFVLPGDMFLPQAGPVGTLLGFFVGACLISFVAVCLSYMVKYAPVAGGAFAYAYIGFGPRAAFVCGWALVIGYLAIVAIDIAALSVIFRFLFPGVFEFGELYSIAGWTVYSGEVILMTAGTFFFGYINYRGIGFAGALQLILAFMLTFGILALFGGVLTLDTASVANLSPAFSDKRSMIACVLLVFAISPFLFVGFDTVPQAAEEFAFDPSRARNIMVVAIFCGVLLYAMVMLSVGMAVPYPELLAKLDAQRATGGAAWGTGEVATMAFGKFGSIVLAVAVFGAVCTGTNGFFIATSRLLLSMSRSGILPAWFGEIHPKPHPLQGHPVHHHRRAADSLRRPLRRGLDRGHELRGYRYRLPVHLPGRPPRDHGQRRRGQEGPQAVLLRRGYHHRRHVHPAPAGARFPRPHRYRPLHLPGRVGRAGLHLLLLQQEALDLPA